MDRIEMIEELRKNADITYETASEILEGTGGDLEAAKTALKKEGLYRKEETAMMTANDYTKKNENTDSTSANGFKKAVRNAAHWTGDKFRRGMHNDFVVESKNGGKFAIPVTLAVILTIIGIEIVPIILIIAFFCGCRFSFSGPDLGSSKINEEMANIRYSCSSEKTEN